MIIEIIITQEMLRTDTFTQYLNGKEVKDLINKINVVFNVVNVENIVKLTHLPVTL